MILVIGLGNPLCGDDGLGKFVADAIQQCFPEGKTRSGQSISTVTRHWASSELTNLIGQADRVIFVNTDRSESTGEIRCRPVEQSPQPRPYTHDLTPAALIESVRVLYGRTPQAIIVSMTSAHFDYRQSLSRSAITALPALLGLVMRLIEDERSIELENCAARKSPQDAMSAG